MCIIVYRLHVIITYPTPPAHVQLHNNILIHTIHQLQQYVIQIIRTVVQKDQPIHPLLSAKVLQARVVIITPLTVHPQLARVPVTTAIRLRMKNNNHSTLVQSLFVIYFVFFVIYYSTSGRLPHGTTYRHYSYRV